MQNQTRGKLKIFFSYADGVGKTSTMFSAAITSKKSGQDVVIGYIEKSDREKMGDLCRELESLPVLTLGEKEELDLDGAIRRKPDLILIDDLAHRNERGCRHRRRYQDIQELIREGIDVFTTVNVQQIESLADVSEAITGIQEEEKIPDSVFDDAEQVELVDAEPEELSVRRSAQPMGQDKLLALRKVALLRMADRINKKTKKIEKSPEDSQIYSGEHILTGLSSSPYNAKSVRSAARMADAFHGMLTAIYVETPQTRNMTEQNRKRLEENIHLAEKLGARIVTVYGEDVAQQIAEYAQISGVTKIVIGRAKRNRGFDRYKHNFTERLASLASKPDIYIIPADTPQNYKIPYLQKRKRGQDKITWSDVLKMAAVLGAVTVLGRGMQFLNFSEHNIILLYIMGVILIAMWIRNRIFNIVSSLCSVIIFNFFFTMPQYSLKAYGPEYPVTFVIMFAAAFVASTLTTRVKQQAHMATEKAYRTEVLLETSQKLQKAGNISEIIAETAEQMRKMLETTILFYLPDANGNLQAQLFPKEGEDCTKYQTKEERAVAVWVYKNNKHAGATTDTLSNAKCLYLAVRGKDMAYAVAGIALEKPLEAFESSLLIAMLNECALAMEKQKLDQEKREVEMNARQERLRANLLRAISHDLRTPLTGISGNASVLMKNSENMEKEQKDKIYQDIYDDAMWLFNLVENLLSVSRIENGNVNLRMQTELLSDVVNEAMHHINRKRSEHHITVEQKDEFLMAKMDTRLIIQVFINIINNAIKYTQPGSSIRISIFRDGKFARVEIADNGEGIANHEKERLFEMFYTVDNKKGDGRRGMGLGLSLCKSIIQVHGGEIGVKDNRPKGSIFYFTLPAEEDVIYE